MTLKSLIPLLSLLFALSTNALADAQARLATFVNQTKEIGRASGRERV